MIEITDNKDIDTVTIKEDVFGIDVEIPKIDFAIITALYFSEEVPIHELCLCYEKQFGKTLAQGA